MKNDYQIGERKISIPPTVLFSVIGRMQDVRKAVSMDLKRVGDLLYLLGETHDELGGSEYYANRNELGSRVPRVDATSARLRYRTLNLAQQQGLIASCHDLSDGGLGVALAESAFAGGFGVRADLSLLAADRGLREDKLLFSESQSRLLVSVAPQNKAAFETLFAGQSCSLFGEVTDRPVLIVHGLRQQELLKVPINDLKEAWQAPLREM